MPAVAAAAAAAAAEPPRVQKWDNGLTLIHDFISPEQEAAIISAFHEDHRPSSLAATTAAAATEAASKKRLSQHFGFHFDYTTFGASETVFTPLPGYMDDILARLPVRGDGLPDQFTVQYYPPGAGIPPHVDTHSLFGEALYSLSLGSAVPIKFRRCGARDARRMRLPKRSLAASKPNEKEERETSTTTSPLPTTAPEASDAGDDAEDAAGDEMELFLPPRSLLLMMGPARYGYTHGIRARKTDVVAGRTVARTGRYSITMRSVKRGAGIGCACDFPGVCDARIAEEEEEEAARASKDKSLS
ncbi:tRNA (carboxymethyluridine(34)-5-O)-methyltransferase [Purpureocillium takamizusanense]|uniref:tRNA (Carboxymethyluridine(34)-5-O)-methyltransferase n=1 Tax=Purpureocillium takamizusanense TaxID=2060973 RepID=A0A9Q8Q9B5_9HYPO|nr:tRNA (carboxymethyluridine(34)-5-O)-methyltransferase [Purpureocillium takamizusanense]UNI16314.1 tRNA (carboxymethyluridine(34)-5-O)-methyltransferase [Purpureocillium takamizusanense]